MPLCIICWETDARVEAFRHAYKGCRCVECMFHPDCRQQYGLSEPCPLCASLAVEPPLTCELCDHGSPATERCYFPDEMGRATPICLACRNRLEAQNLSHARVVVGLCTLLTLWLGGVHVVPELLMLWWVAHRSRHKQLGSYLGTCVIAALRVYYMQSDVDPRARVVYALLAIFMWMFKYP